MKVNLETVRRLKEKQEFVRLTKGFDADFAGVYYCLMRKLYREAVEGNDIRTNRPYPWLEIRSRHFTQEEIKDIALNKFARYMHYELGRGLKEELKVRAYNAHKGNPMEDWLHALDEVAQQITYHWGTPLEAVA